MTALFVTTSIPWTYERSRHALFQRMRVMLDATRNAHSEVRVVLIAPMVALPQEANPDDIARRFQDELGVGFDVRLEPVYAPDEASSGGIGSSLERYFGSSPLALAALPQARLAVARHARELDPDAIIAHRLQAFAAVRRALPAGHPRLFLDLDDVEHVAYWRSTLGPPRWRTKYLRLIHLPELVLEEWRAMRHCERVFVCSELDVGKLVFPGARAPALAVSNSIEDPILEEDGAPSPGEDRVLFVGSFSYEPNRLGIEWFSREIWPLVVEHRPRARLHIVGRGGQAIDLPSSVTGSVEIHGFVDDIASVYGRSDVVVCPILAGGGTRVKLIEAAAYARAMISTTLGAEGLEFQDRKSILIEDHPAEFASTVIKALESPELRDRIGSEARRVFRRRYRREVVVSDLSSVLAGRELPCSDLNG